MKNAVVTAGNSFIGNRLCKALEEEGYYVYAIVRECFDDELFFSDESSIQVVKCDMENYGSLHDLINVHCDVAAALAWDGTRGGARDDAVRQEKNILYTKHFIESMRMSGCDTIVTAGSQAEYGPWNMERKISEDDSCFPNTEYGKAKLKLFNWAKDYCSTSNIRIIEPRFFSLYGEYDFEGTMVISTLRKMLKNEECNLTQGVQLWDFLHVDDAIRGVMALINNKKAYGIYNFGYGVSKPLREYVEEMRKITKSSSIINYGAVPYPPTGIVHTNPDVGKLMHDVGWKPEISFYEGIKRIIERQMRNEDY